MTAFIYRESSSGEGVGRCGASTAFDLDNQLAKLAQGREVDVMRTVSV